MPYAYAEIRSLISDFILGGLGLRCPLDADSGHGEFTAPLGYALGRDARECAARLTELNGLRPPAFLGAALIGGITALDGHVCFRLTAGAYSAAVKRTLAERPMPDVPEDTGDEVSYALARMLMLSRQAGEGCPDDGRVRAALWMCYGIEGFGGKKREAMRRRAAAALLNMLDGRPYREREALRRRMGEAAGCAARLLCIPGDM